MLIEFKDLLPRHNLNIKGIVHCGSSSGQERQAYADLGIEKVIWIEAVKEIYNELIENLKPYPFQIGVNACLGEVDGKDVVFNVSNNEGQSSSYLQLGFHKTAHPEVSYVRHFETKTKTLQTVLKELGVEIGDGWLLAIDTQGAEIFVLKGAGDLLNNFDAIYLETNTKEVYEGCALKPEIEEYLSKYDYEPVEEFIYEHWGWGDQLLKRNKKSNVA
ncbi:MAG TPA: FkbM family methyltransferase [Chitinophagaceae bacterium]|nr:FkbM family methyltransferase [Chitinophagaceae bacterium]